VCLIQARCWLPVRAPSKFFLVTVLAHTTGHFIKKIFIFVIAEMELRFLCVPGKCCTPELHPQPFSKRLKKILRLIVNLFVERSKISKAKSCQVKSKLIWLMYNLDFALPDFSHKVNDWTVDTNSQERKVLSFGSRLRGSASSPL
jgi:hypothetical protein